MSDTTYNGWTNYETWNVALWLDNEEGSYNHWNSRAQDIWEDTDSDDDIETRNQDAALELSKEIKSEIEDAAPDLGASCFADLLGAALSEVNWYEIAEHYISEVDKTVEEPEEDDDETAER